ncbi:phosphatase domain-containing protein [Qipengyuania sp. DSG2-2]|uniref:phosphatase domain-containing protein n=1 Tax=Qipengyuania sp. DGS2-2 TaxID=3349631 RepID=UPI0036D247E1
MPLFPSAPVRLQPYYGYRTATRLYVSARALRADKASFDKSGRLQAMRTMIAQFASHEVEGLDVRLELEIGDTGKHSFTAQTDKEGHARFAIDLPDVWSLPENTAWDVAALYWSNEEGEHCVNCHILAPGARADLAVISDIDDTIIETGITGGLRSVFRNWRRVLQQMPEERVAVPGADVFYSSLGGGRVLAADEAGTGDRIPATHRPFFYVSSSPWNLYSYLVAYKKDRDIPLGPLFLRDWGLNSDTFGSGSHGSHKTDAIRGILADYSELRFALIGDDSQGDLPAFGEIVEQHPGRIAAVFIRQTGGEASPEEIAAKAIIKGASVPLWMGDGYGDMQGFLKAAGVSAAGDTARILQATVKAEDAN